MRQLTVLKRRLLVNLRERNKLAMHVASLIQQRDRAFRRRDDAVLRLDSALQRVRLLEWVHNVSGSQISKGKIIIAFIRKLTAGV